MDYLAIDTEVAGLDKFHGARPFLVTMCDGGPPVCYHWHVDPYTRQPEVSKKHLLSIRKAIYDAERVIGQHIKFDYQCLFLLFRDHHISFTPPWNKTYDTLMAGHLLYSNRPHDLTSMAIQYLGEDITKYEKALKEQVIKAQRVARKDLSDWNLATKDNKMTPSARKSSWGFDMWLPRAIAKQHRYDSTHQWWTVVEEYANCDSITTYYLWLEMEKQIKARGLWEIFRERMRLAEVAMELEMPFVQGEIRSITLNRKRLEKMIGRCKKESKQFAKVCTSIAHSYDYPLELPRSGNNQSLQRFCFGSDNLSCKKCGYTHWLREEEKQELLETGMLEGAYPTCPLCTEEEEEVRFNSEEGIVSGLVTLSLEREPYLDLPIVKWTGAGAPSLDKTALENYSDFLPFKSKQRAFIKALQERRKRNTAIQYLEGYRRYWQLAKTDDPFGPIEWYGLQGSANPTGTNTLRWSFSNPNSANISKQDNFNLRFIFGPLPGREWYSMDGQNLELRIPAYESGETDMIWIFDHPNDPPYYGSYHLLVFDLLHPEKFKEYGVKCKEEFEATWYQWTKNGNFALIYGCQEAKADITYHVQGAYKMMRKRFPKIAALSDKQIALANKYGYVETIPDRLVDPRRGYPIMTSRTDRGQVLPTVPLNYHIQSTAMQWTNCGMIECHKRIKEWQREGWTGYIVLQVHDELVFDTPILDQKNLWRIAELKRIMEASGDRIGVPTPVSVERNRVSWDVGEKITKELEQLHLAV